MYVFQTILSEIRQRFEIESGKTKVVSEIIKNISGVTISEKDILIRKGMIVTTLPSTMKMAVFIKKQEIINECNNRKIAISTIV